MFSVISLNKGRQAHAAVVYHAHTFGHCPDFVRVCFRACVIVLAAGSVGGVAVAVAGAAVLLAGLCDGGVVDVFTALEPAARGWAPRGAASVGEKKKDLVVKSFFFARTLVWVFVVLFAFVLLESVFVVVESKTLFVLFVLFIFVQCLCLSLSLCTCLRACVREYV